MTELASPPTAPQAAIAAAGGYARLDQFGVIDARGPDALSFLHNQLTNDVAHLDLSAAQIGGLCSPKGRLIASFLYWQDIGTIAAATDAANATDTGLAASATTDAGVRLLVAADIREAIQKRLSMFVLRSKVKLSDATAKVVLIGLSAPVDNGDALQSALSSRFEALPDVTRGRSDGPAGTLIRLSDAAGYLRYLWAAPIETWDDVRATLDAALQPFTPATWDWLEVNSGEARITAATQDAFVPQMINYEAIGGVSFRKGCYPGQEIVARSQYRGTVKRRATVGHADAAQAGEEVFEESDPQQPCGHIVNTAPTADGGVDCLVELKLSLASDALLHVGSVEGPRLAVRGLPYALPTLD